MVIYLDSGWIDDMASYVDRVSGFTTNPSLLKAAGTTDYRACAREAIRLVRGKPISFEVFADSLTEMGMQAIEIASWGENVYVKIPVTNTKGESTGTLVNSLSKKGIKVNVTALFTMQQIREMAHYLTDTPAILSIFAGRIADTGVDPTPFFTAGMHVKHSNTQLLWASTREVYNVKQAQNAGADIITMSPDLIKKMSLFGKDLNEYSRETVQMFLKDSEGLSL